MNIFGRLFAVSGFIAGLVEAGWAGFWDGGLAVVFTAGACCWGGVPEVESEVFACPMARAFSETASDLVFSRICFCFSSSFVKIGTRSSGIGFLSCDRRFNQSRTER